MNEIERLIAAAAEPGPSRRLDERIHNLLVSEIPSTVRPPHRRRDVATLLTTAACVGIVGFFLGRASALRPATAPRSTANVVEIAPPNKPSGPESPVPTQVVQVPLTDEQLAAFFARPAGREGPFGDVAAIVTRSSSHPE